MCLELGQFHLAGASLVADWAHGVRRVVIMGGNVLCKLIVGVKDLAALGARSLWLTKCIHKPTVTSMSVASNNPTLHAVASSHSRTCKN